MDVLDSLLADPLRKQGSVKTPKRRPIHTPRIAVFWLAAALAVTAPAMAEKREPEPAGFTTILPVPSARLVEVVRHGVNDKTIRSSFQYEKETSLDGAEAAPQSSAFPPWTEGGELCHKVNREALSRAHFFQSTDIATVTARYVIQPLSGGGSQLRIEAVFIEDGHRHKPHVSDGSVENAEYKAIAESLHAIEQKEQEAREQAKRDAEEKELAELQSALAEEDLLLAASSRSRADLEKRAEDLRHGLAARVKTAGVPLKSAPYNHAATLQPLGRDELVTILEFTPFWLRVREPQGQEGWVYRLLLE